MSDAPHVVVVGGGITGLTAAYRLAQYAAPAGGVDVTLVEASSQLGGKLLTTPFLGHDVDEGADAFLRRDPAALELADELGLSERLVTPAAGTALIVRSRRRKFGHARRLTMVPLPSQHVLGVPVGVMSLARSGVVGPLGLVRATLDLVMPDNWTGTDEPVGSLIRRRLGDGVADGLVGPLLGGINAGDIDQMETTAVAPPLAKLARRGGSLMRAAKDHLAETASSVSGGAPQAPIFASFDGGMGVLVDRLVEALTSASGTSAPGTSAPVTVRTATAVRDVVRVAPETARDGLAPDAARRWRVALDDGAHLDADAVVLTAPAHQTSRMLGGIAPTVARGLAGVPFASVAIVTLGYERASVGVPLDAAGALVPRQLGLLTTACSFGSSKWPHWADADTEVFRASVGRDTDRRWRDLDDDELVRKVSDELSRLLNIDGPPLGTRVSRWANSMPQYTTGHTARVRQLRAELAASAPGLVLAGASYEGLGVPACVRQGTEAARAALGHLALPASS